MTKNDIRIAETIGYTLWEYTTEERRQFVMRYVNTFTSSLYRQLNWGKYEHSKVCPHRKLLPFDSAPFWESDGIILKWVQGRHELIFEMQFNNAVRGIITKMQDEPEDERYYLNFFLRHYKPGMYAQAVLEE